MNFTTYFPIIKIDENVEVIVLFPSETIRRSKTIEQSFLDAACICKNINRLKELRKQQILNKKLN